MTPIVSLPKRVPGRWAGVATGVGGATCPGGRMTRSGWVLVALLSLLPAASALAQESQATAAVADDGDRVAGTPAGPAADAVDDSAEAAETPAQPVAAATPDQPKTMSGMSILGNEEAPKALVIVPWKSSELGDELGMSESLDDQALPVDKQVFMRKLEFYEIRKED